MCKEELVVFGGDGSHHKAEDVKEGTEEEDVTGTIGIVVFTNYGTEEEHA